MPKIIGLGSGISDLLELESMAESSVSTDHSVSAVYRQIPLDQLTPSRYQPRKEFDTTELEELSQSIKVQGIIQPILVTPFNDGFEIVAGERRWRAAIKAGLSSIPAVIKDLSDSKIAAITLVENLQRKDLNIVEEAEGLSRLSHEFKLTHEEIAEHTGRSRPYISNVLRLLNLEEPIITLLREGHLDMGHGRALLGASPVDQLPLANQVIQDQLTVRVTEELVRAGRESTPKIKRPPSRSFIVREDQAKLIAESLRAEVRIRETDGLLYDIRIKCVGTKELNSILQIIAPDMSIE